MTLKNKMIMEEYLEQRADFVQLGDVVHNMLKNALQKNDISPLAIEHRVKAEESLAGKLELKGDKYASLADITDILGARVISFFSDEVDVIAKLVEEMFVVDWENSVDKRKVLSPDSFGYLSLHYICSLPFDKGYPENICGKKFEIQIRSTLQHTWAAINHDLGYKSDFGVPRSVVRGFSRIAGLLEVADAQFVAVRDEIHGYCDDVRHKIANNEADELGIDNVSLSEYVQNNKEMRAFLNEICGLCGNAEISEISPEPYIQQLSFLNIKKLGDLHNALTANKELALKLAKRSLENTDLDILSSSTGLRFLCRAVLITGKYTEEEIAQFMKISLGDEQRALRQAKRLLRLADELEG